MQRMHEFHRRTKIALAVAAGLIAVLAVALVVLLNFGWNRAKPWLNARASEALGRPFTIAGDLSLSWEKQATGTAEQDRGWRGLIPWPHLVAQDIHIRNPSEIVVPCCCTYCFCPEPGLRC